MSDNILIRESDGCLQLSLNRPDKKNALTRAMYQALRDALLNAEHRDTVRVVRLDGLPGMFCAGNDLADFLAYANGATADRSVEDFLTALTRLTKPLVAVVRGPAIGIGTTMLLHADVVIASDTARFQTPFASLGLCAEGGSSVLMPLRMGHAQAARMLLLGETVDSAFARDTGLISLSCTEDEIDLVAERTVQRLLALPLASLQATKRLMKAHWADAVESAMQEEFHAFRRLLTGPAAREALTAFAEKRQPDFRKVGA